MGGGGAAPLIDVLHRSPWLLEHGPTLISAFLEKAYTNLEQLRTIAEALRGPALTRAGASDASAPTPEICALSKLTSNWRSVTEGAVCSLETHYKSTDQQNLSLDPSPIPPPRIKKTR